MGPGLFLTILLLISFIICIIVYTICKILKTVMYYSKKLDDREFILVAITCGLMVIAIMMLIALLIFSISQI